MKSTVLILSTTPLWTPHHAESIELAHRLSKKNKVLYLACTGALSSCPANPTHDIKVCKKCRRQTRYAKNKLLPKGTAFIEIDFKGHEEIKVNDVSSMDELYSMKYDSMPVGKLVASQISNEEKGEYFSVKNTMGMIRKLNADAISLFKSVEELIVQRDVSEVYSWNGRRPSDGPALWAAKKHDVKYFAYISGGTVGDIFVIDALSVQDFEGRFRDKKNMQRRINMLPGMKVRVEAESYFNGYRQNNLNQVGYRYDPGVNSEPFIVPRSEKKILLIPTSSPREHIHQATYDDYYGTDPYGRFLELLEYSELFDEFTVVVRWHPFNRNNNKETRKRILELQERYDQAIHIPPESNVDTYAILGQSDVVYATGSTVSQYAALNSKPVLIYGPGGVLFEDSVFSVSSAKEAYETLISGSYLKERNTDGVSYLAYYNKNFGEPMRYVYNEGLSGSWDSWFVKGPSFLQPRKIRKIGFLDYLRKIKYHIMKKLSSIILSKHDGPLII